MVKSKYDTIEDKYSQAPSNKQRKKPLSSFMFRRTKKSHHEEPLQKQNGRCESLATPDTLAFMASKKVNQLKTPQAMFWTVQHVKDFINQMGNPFTFYADAFSENLINGRWLMLVDATALVKMNITDFDHIKIISEEIRKLYEIEAVRFERSISLPPRYPLTHYKLHERQTGWKYRCCRASDLFQKMKLIDPSSKNENHHWTKLENWLKHFPDKKTIRVGYAPRRMLYQNAKLAVKATVQKENLCDCIPPCQCEWNDRDIRYPWVLNCLQDKSHAKYINETLMFDINKTSLHAVADLNATCNSHCPSGKVLTILKKAFPHKYNTHIDVTL